MNITIGLAIFLLAIMVVVWGLRIRARTGLPWVPVAYSDTGWYPPERALTARKIGLTGKPDYLLNLGGRLVPVEVKPGRMAAQPYESDLMQLAGYCLLVEETEGVAPPYGLLRYAERTFRLDYTPQVREDVLALVLAIRATLEAEDCERSHTDPGRCYGCGFRHQCTESLVEGVEEEFDE